MNIGLLHTAKAFIATKRHARRMRTREDVLAWQAARLERHLRRMLPRLEFYADKPAQRLEDLPIVDKTLMMNQFERFNRAGLTFAQARDAIDGGQERIDGLVIGHSTGTSGNRGVFVISEAERFTWLGVMLAKALPDALWHRHKIALALPAYNALYASATETGRMTLRFFDLSRGIEAWRDDLRAYGPTVIVAPPKMLRALAEGGGLSPARVFSGGEVLDQLDRQVIETAFGIPVREIYMATEGLFGVGCSHGVLHLAEDVVAFEWERPVEGGVLTAPIVTDFTRTTQAMVRYRMNDLLQLQCGSVHSPRTKFWSHSGRN